MNALPMPATRRRTQVVILQSLELRDKSSNLSHAAILGWAKRILSPMRILRALFCEKASIAVAIATVCAMWWRILTVADPGMAIASDCLYALPWLLVWTARASFSNLNDPRL